MGRGRRSAVVIGAGHNGLVCAFDLARAGFAVRVFERRGVIGGAAVTEEFHPGFRNSVASYTVGLLDPGVIADMRLHERGLRILERPISNFLPLDDGRFLEMGGGLERSRREVAKFSARDAERLPAYQASIEAVADRLRELALQTPPELGRPGLASGLRAWRQSHGLASLDLEGRRDLLDLFTKSARELLDGWFESDPIKAVLGFDSIVGHWASPDTPGSAYVLLHHAFGGVNGKKGVWGHAIGGMGAITQAMGDACRDAGVTIETGAAVAALIVDGDSPAKARVRGVRLADGRTVEADVVASNLSPRLLFERLVPPDALEPAFRERMGRYRCGSGTLRMNIALSALPRFAAKPSEQAGDHHASGIVLAPSLDYMDRAFVDARSLGWSREPVVEMLIPSVVDDTLAPPGAHVASLFCQQFAFDLPAGRTWSDAERDAAADAALAVIERHAPGFRASIVGRSILSPLDLERTFGLVGGDIMHGRMSLDQMWAARPILGHGDYRAPIRGLYLCGAGSHPGGGVTGMPGRNAAREVVRDAGTLLRRLCGRRDTKHAARLARRTRRSELPWRRPTRRVGAVR